MNSCLIKFCGFTRQQDLLCAFELGVDWLGVNFYRGPRRLPWPLPTLDLTPFGPRLVALIDPAQSPSPRQLHDALGIQTFQLYPANPVSVPELFSTGLEYWSVWRIASAEDLKSLSSRLEKLPPPRAIVLDAAIAGLEGGSGHALDWELLAEHRSASWPPLILAGGLTPDNVAHAVRLLRPWAVDAASGVEISPGVKDPIKMRDFLQAARQA